MVSHSRDTQSCISTVYTTTIHIHNFHDFPGPRNSKLHGFPGLKSCTFDDCPGAMLACIPLLQHYKQYLITLVATEFSEWPLNVLKSKNKIHINSKRVWQKRCTVRSSTVQQCVHNSPCQNVCIWWAYTCRHQCAISHSSYPLYFEWSTASVLYHSTEVICFKVDTYLVFIYLALAMCISFGTGKLATRFCQ